MSSFPSSASRAALAADPPVRLFSPPGLPDDGQEQLHAPHSRLGQFRSAERRRSENRRDGTLRKLWAPDFGGATRAPSPTWSKPPAAAEQAACRFLDTPVAKAKAGYSACGPLPPWIGTLCQCRRRLRRTAKSRADEKRVERPRFAVIERPRQAKKDLVRGWGAAHVGFLITPARRGGAQPIRRVGFRSVRLLPEFLFLRSFAQAQCKTTRPPT